MKVKLTKERIEKDLKFFMGEHSTIKTFLDGVEEDCRLMREGK